MIIKNATFMQSVVDWRKCPPPTMPEYAFIGRSNVGKSSLINMLVNNKKLAKTSSKPGKTQTINHFLINKEWYLVDLPGYGYASISKAMRDKWKKMIDDYLVQRENLQVVFVLIDSRHDIGRIDLDFLSELGEHGIPFAIVFTKTDKSGPVALQQQIERDCAILSQTWEELPPMLASSSHKRTGKEEILDYIDSILKTL